jgi:hypothetical protein
MGEVDKWRQKQIIIKSSNGWFLPLPLVLSNEINI